ncbi:MAG: response regulator transcription factor [Clostridia bacterium]|nr:response regulator transcription factor [Clostridia bacterium]
MINVGIIEDDELAASRLAEMLKLYGQEKNASFSVSIFDSAEEALRQAAGKFDVLFIDIELGGLDGMSAAREIRKNDEKTVIVFVTNVARLAVEGYSVGALDYIVKPVGKARFFQTMNGVMKKLERLRSVKIAVSTTGGTALLDSAEITYVEVFGHCLVYHTGGESVSEWAPLSRAEKILSNYGFARCSKSCLVNLRYVTGIDGDEAVVAGKKIKIGRNKRKAFLAELNTYINK